VAELDDVTVGGGGSGQKVFTASSIEGDFYLPIVVGFDYNLRLHAASPNGLIEVASTGVKIASGTTTSVFFAHPQRFLFGDTIGITPPVLQQGSFEFRNAGGTITPTLILKGQNFLQVNPYPGSYLSSDPTLGNKVEDLVVTLELGGRDTIGLDGELLVLGGRDYTIPGTMMEIDDDGNLLVTIPPGVNLSNAFITVTRPMLSPLDGEFRRREFTSNPVGLLPLSKYGFVAVGPTGQVSVVDITTTSTFPSQGDEITKSTPKQVAVITLGKDTAREGMLSPRSFTISPDGSRAYVTLERNAGIAIIDTTALHEIDTDFNTPGIQHISLPVGANPFRIAIDGEGKFLYASDYLTSHIYVVDIDPFSSDYHKLVRTIVPDARAPLGLRGIAVSKDGSTIYAAAPGQDLFSGYGREQGAVLILRGDTNFPMRDRVFSTVEIKVGPTPYGISITDDPDVLIVTDRLAKAFGMSIISTWRNSGNSAGSPKAGRRRCSV
jgi:DNA-binding beta-propeller fold protein YncE